MSAMPEWMAGLLVVPLYPGTKKAKGRWGKARWLATPEQTCVMTLAELDRRSAEFAPYDVGVLLEPNGLLLIDADTDEKTGTEAENIANDVLRRTVTFGEMAAKLHIDGPANLHAWMDEHPGAMPDTFEELSPGDPGRHDRGTHRLYRQNLDEPLHGHWNMLPGVEVKANHGIMRVALPHGGNVVSEVTRAVEPVTLPAETARLLRGSVYKPERKQAANMPLGSGEDCQDLELFKEMQRLRKQGVPESEAYAIWQELSVAHDPARPWLREHFERHFRDTGEWKPAENVYAGQGHNVRDNRTPQNNPDIRPLTCINAIKAKVRAEQHVDELSTDWHSAPHGCRYFYEGAVKKIIAGKIVTVYDPEIVAERRFHNGDACIEWLTSAEHPLLKIDATTGRIAALGDPVRPKAEKYPGWDDACESAGVTRNPAAGDRWPLAELSELVLELVKRAVVEGERPPRAWFARLLQAEALRLGRHALTVRMIKSALDHLEETGQMHQAEDGRHYRKGHQWHWFPPRYELGQAPPERQAEIALRREERRLRREANAIVRSLAGVLSWISPDLFADREVPV